MACSRPPLPTRRIRRLVVDMIEEDDVEKFCVAGEYQRRAEG